MRLALYKKVNSVIRLAIIYVTLFLAVCSFVPGGVTRAADDGSETGYKSWIRGTSGDPNGARLGIGNGVEKEDKEVVNATAENDKPNTVEKILSQMVAGFGTGMRKAFQGNNHLDASTTGIIMGNVVNGSGFFVFDLKDENYWGLVGAYIYTALRIIMIMSIFVTTLAQVFTSVWKGESRNVIRSAIITAFLSIFFLSVMPKVADWICETRDFLEVQVYEGVEKNISNFGEIGYYNTKTGVKVSSKIDQSLANTIEGIYYAKYTETPNMINAIVYALVCCLPLAFMLDYIRLALMQTITFSIFPLFGFLGSLDRGESVKKWTETFVGNALVPVLDMGLIFIPTLLIHAITEVGDINPDNLFILIFLVVCFWGIIPARNKALNLLMSVGGFGLEHGTSLGGLLGKAIKTGASVVKGVAGVVNDFKDNAQGASKGDISEAETAEKSLDEQINPKADDAEAAVLSETNSGFAGIDKPDDNAKDRIGEFMKGVEEQFSGASNSSESTSDSEVEPELHGPTTNESLNESGDATISGVEINTVTAESSTIGASEELDNIGGSSSINEAISNVDDAEKLIDDLSVSSSDMAKEAEENSKSLASQINKNSYVAGKGEHHIDHRKFNTARAANLKSIGNMKEAVSSIDKSNVSVNKDTAKQQKIIADNRKKLNDLYKAHGITRDENGKYDRYAIDQLKEYNGSFRREAASYTNAINAARDKIDDNKAIISNNNANKAALQGEIGRRKDIEKSYADSYSQTGRSGQTFESAEDFSRQLELESRARDIVNLSNYKELYDKGVLSDQQRLQFQRKAAIKQAAGKAIIGAGTVAAAAAMTPIALASGDANTASSIIGASRSVAVAGGEAAKASVYVGKEVGKRGISAASKIAQKTDNTAVTFMKQKIQESTPRYRKATVVSNSGAEMATNRATEKENRVSRFENSGNIVTNYSSKQETKKNNHS